MSALVYQGFRLTFGLLYPAYSSFKAVRSKNVKEYVKWMMYWIVFAIFSFVEAFADFILVWFPFYCELKICFIIWLVSPATRGSSILYRKVVHPQLLKREKEIDANISKATDESYAALISLGSRGFSFATNMVLSTAVRGHSRLSDQLQKSWSLNDLSGDAADYQPFRRQQPNLEDDDDENDDRTVSERHRSKTKISEKVASLDEIDRDLEDLPVLQSSEPRIRRRRRAAKDSVGQTVSDENKSTLAESLVGSVRISRRYMPAVKDIKEESNAEVVSSSTGSTGKTGTIATTTSPEANVESAPVSVASSSLSSSGFPTSISHYFRSGNAETSSSSSSAFSSWRLRSNFFSSDSTDSKPK